MAGMNQLLTYTIEAVWIARFVMGVFLMLGLGLGALYVAFRVLLDIGQRRYRQWIG